MFVIDGEGHRGGIRWRRPRVAWEWIRRLGSPCGCKTEQGLQSRAVSCSLSGPRFTPRSIPAPYQVGTQASLCGHQAPGRSKSGSSEVTAQLQLRNWLMQMECVYSRIPGFTAEWSFKQCKHSRYRSHRKAGGFLFLTSGLKKFFYNCKSSV